MQISRRHQELKGGERMADRKIRVQPVRRAELDIDKLVAGLLALLRERAEHETSAGKDSGEEPAA